MLKNKKIWNWLMVFSIPIVVCLQALYHIIMRLGIADVVPLYVKQFGYFVFFNLLFPLIFVTILGIIFLIKNRIYKNKDTRVSRKSRLSIIMGVVNRIATVLLFLSLLFISVYGSIRQYNIFYASYKGDIFFQEGNYSEALINYNLAMNDEYAKNVNSILIRVAIASYMGGGIERADRILMDVVNRGGDVKSLYEQFMSYNKEYIDKNDLDIINKYFTGFSGIGEVNGITVAKQLDFKILTTGFDASVIEEQGNTIYDIAKTDILSILPNNLRIDIEKLFVEFDNAKLDEETGLSENDSRKVILIKILELISQKITTDSENQKLDEITQDDMDIIVLPDICEIMEYYTIPNDVCDLGFIE